MPTPARHLFTSCLFLLLAFVPALSGEARDEPDRRAVEIQATYNATLDREDAAELPPGMFYADAEAFAGWWEASGLEADDLPEIDFDASFVCIEVRDAADPNRVHYNPGVNEQGELEMMSITTLIGFQPSDRARYSFLVLSREGITGVARWRPVANEAGNAHMFRIVYPLNPEAEGDADEEEGDADEAEGGAA